MLWMLVFLIGMGAPMMGAPIIGPPNLNFPYIWLRSSATLCLGVSFSILLSSNCPIIFFGDFGICVGVGFGRGLSFCGGGLLGWRISLFGNSTLLAVFCGDLGYTMGGEMLGIWSLPGATLGGGGGEEPIYCVPLFSHMAFSCPKFDMPVLYNYTKSMILQISKNQKWPIYVYSLLFWLKVSSKENSYILITELFPELIRHS